MGGSIAAIGMGLAVIGAGIGIGQIGGKAMEAIFPEGLTIKTADDWNRIHLFLLNMVKVTRYANNYNTGGHEDSLRDAIVYNAMLQFVDEMIQEEKVRKIFEEDNAQSALF